MAKLIACCGLNCDACEARVATIKNDNELRAKIAARMQAHYRNPNITIEMINCMGCREGGAIMWYCEQCEIKKCILSKAFQTCAECEKLNDCPMVRKINQYDPKALENLKTLK
jgi:hypothetical protein